MSAGNLLQPDLWEALKHELYHLGRGSQPLVILISQLLAAGCLRVGMHNEWAKAAPVWLRGILGERGQPCAISYKCSQQWGGAGNGSGPPSGRGTNSMHYRHNINASKSPFFQGLLMIIHA